jgi:uncharacterized coiled-coil DUF342 family protein
VSGSQELLERLGALKRDANHVTEQIQALREGVEQLHAQLIEAEQDRRALREQRESLETQIMDMIREFDDPSFPDNIRYFPGSHPDDVA